MKKEEVLSLFVQTGVAKISQVDQVNIKQWQVLHKKTHTVH